MSRPPYYCVACDQFSRSAHHHRLADVTEGISVLLVVFGPGLLFALWLCGVLR